MSCTTRLSKEERAKRTQQIKTYLNDRFGAGSTTIYDYTKKVGNIVDHGWFENMAFHVWSSSELGTEYHEAFHGLFHMFLNDKQRTQILKEAKKKYGELSNTELEEKLADDFKGYQITNENISTPGKIGKFFKDLFYLIKSLVTDSVSVNQVFSMLETNRIPAKFKLWSTCVFSAQVSRSADFK